MFGILFDNVIEKKLIIMKKVYLFDLFDLMVNQWYYDSGHLNQQNKSEFPTDNDQNFNKSVEEMETETHKITKEVWVSTDGTTKYIRTSSHSKKPKVDVSVLESKLKKAIETENFELAAELRDEIRKHKKSGI